MRRNAKRIALVVLISWTAVGFLSNSAIAVDDSQVREVPSGGSSGSQMGKMPSPEEARRMMEEMMAGVMGQMIEGMARSMAKPEVAQNLAVFARNYYNALIKQGFSEEEALKIVTASGLPSIGGKH